MKTTQSKAQDKVKTSYNHHNTLFLSGNEIICVFCPKPDFTPYFSHNRFLVEISACFRGENLKVNFSWLHGPKPHKDCIMKENCNWESNQACNDWLKFEFHFVWICNAAKRHTYCEMHAFRSKTTGFVCVPFGRKSTSIKIIFVRVSRLSLDGDFSFSDCHGIFWYFFFEIPYPFTN